MYFADRDDYIERFKDFCAASNKTEWVLVYYGLDGLGKTTLLKHLYEHVCDKKSAAFIDFGVQANRNYSDRVLAILAESFRNGLSSLEAWDTYQQELQNNADTLEYIRIEIQQKNQAEKNSSISNSPQTANVHYHEDARLTTERIRKATLANTDSLLELARHVVGSFVIFIDHWESVVRGVSPVTETWVIQGLLYELKQRKSDIKVVFANDRRIQIRQYGSGIINLPLSPLTFTSAQGIMKYAGLTDEGKQREVFQGTGGNPLLLEEALMLWKLNPQEDLSKLEADSGVRAASKWLLQRIIPGLADERSRVALERGGILQYWSLDALQAVCQRKDFDFSWLGDFMSEPIVQEAIGQTGYMEFNRTVRQTLIEILWVHNRQWFHDGHSSAHAFFVKRKEGGGL